MSNLLAAVGRGQLRHLDEKVARRREINRRYRAALGDLEGMSFMPEASFGPKHPLAHRRADRPGRLRCRPRPC